MRRILDVDSLILVTEKVIEREWQRIVFFALKIIGFYHLTFFKYLLEIFISFFFNFWI